MFGQSADGPRQSLPRLVNIMLRYSVFLISTLIAAQTANIVVENGVHMKTRDGVTLVSDVYRPSAEGKHPAMLMRTPYNRAGESGNAVRIAAHGYAVVIQDSRGRFDSGGEFYPFKYESQDGYDTVEWVAAQPWSNGKVGMFGGSYVGATQMLASIATPPHLVAIFPYVTASEYYDGWTYQSGALMQWFTASWSSGLVVDTVRRKTAEAIDAKKWVESAPGDRYPMAKLPAVASLAPYYHDWIAHATDDAYWKAWKISDHYAAMNIKALHAGGWHDIFLKGTLNNYIGMRAASPAKADQRLMIGPWAHAATSPEGKVGDVTFGKQAALDMTGITIRWADFALKGKQNEFGTGAAVRIFVMGENVWRDEHEFPLARTHYTNYYLHAGGLGTDKPAAEKPDVFAFDPTHPVPTIGGRLCCGNEIPPGPANQSPNEKRKDVLVYSTPPLEHDVEATGWIKATLYASSAAPDADFTAILTDVAPDGYSRFLTDGIVRVTNASKPAEYTIDMWATSNVFRAGHRVRLDISSSNFPRFGLAAHSHKALHTVYHDGSHPSALILPVIPR